MCRYILIQLVTIITLLICPTLRPVHSSNRSSLPPPVRGNALGRRVFNIRAFGAVGDGIQLDTAAIQAAIDTCSAKGGGTVLVPPGKYLTGTLFLKSNVNLHVASTATILGSPT